MTSQHPTRANGLSQRAKWVIAALTWLAAIVLGFIFLPDIFATEDTHYIGAVAVTFTLASIFWIVAGKLIRGFEWAKSPTYVIQNLFTALGVITAYWALLRDTHFKWSDLPFTTFVALDLTLALLAFVSLIAWVLGGFKPLGKWMKTFLSYVVRRLATRLTDGDKRTLANALTAELEKRDAATSEDAGASGPVQ